MDVRLAVGVPLCDEDGLSECDCVAEYEGVIEDVRLGVQLLV